MPRFKLKGVLERDALTDWWKHTLSKIPSTFGQLVYMSSLRDARSGVYHHHGLSSTFGREESKRALVSSHQTVFADWLRLSLSEKTVDLRSYVSAGDESAVTVLQHWRRSGSTRSQFPASASPAERELFVQELELLLDLLTAEFKPETGSAAAAHDQGS